MRKEEFISKLRKKLSGMPKKEIEERLNFYSEMIDDKIEEGILEDDAVSSLGSIDSIAEQIISDIPFSKIAKERMTKKRSFKTWEIVLIAVGSPIWFSLLVALFSVVISLFAVVFALEVSLWAIIVSLAVCSPFVVVAGFISIFVNNAPIGLLFIGSGLILAGLSIVLFLIVKPTFKGGFSIVKKLALWVKKLFVKKEDL